MLLNSISAVRDLRARLDLDNAEGDHQRKLDRQVHRAGLDGVRVHVSLAVPPLDQAGISRQLLGPDATAEACETLRGFMIDPGRAWFILYDRDELALLSVFLDWVVRLGNYRHPRWYDLILACGATGMEALPGPTAKAWTERGRNWAKRRHRMREEYTATSEARIFGPTNAPGKRR